MNVLVTGHHGYIGAVAVEMLKARGYRVTGLDINYYHDCRFEDGVSPDRELILDVRAVSEKDLEGVDAVFHLAALSNDPTGELNPTLTADINYRASVRLAGLAKKAGVGRFIFSSSCSLYGKAENGRAKTETDETQPLTEYAKSKVLSEQAIRELADDGFSPVFLRNSTAYGASPKLRLDLVLNNLMAVAFTTGQIRIMSDGTPWRPVIHARDIVLAFIAALEAPRDAVHNQVFNVGADLENYQVKDLAAIVQQALGRCEVVFTGEHGADSRSYRVSFQKIRRALPNFRPEWTAARGAEELLRKFRERKLSAEDFASRKFFRLRQIEHLLKTGQVNAQLERA